MPSPGIENRSPACKAGMLTSTLTRLSGEGQTPTISEQGIAGSNRSGLIESAYDKVSGKGDFSNSVKRNMGAYINKFERI